jgi:hypothetical protein
VPDTRILCCMLTFSLVALLDLLPTWLPCKWNWSRYVGFFFDIVKKFDLDDC